MTLRQVLLNTLLDIILYLKTIVFCLKVTLPSEHNNNDVLDAYKESYLRN